MTVVSQFKSVTFNSAMSDARPWWVYIIRTRAGKLYTGITTDVERRFREHSEGRGARFFRGDPPDAVVHRESVADRAEASRREAAIKALSRGEKLTLIEAGETIG